MLFSVGCIKLEVIRHVLSFENRQVQRAIRHEPWLPFVEPSRVLGSWQDTWQTPADPALPCCVWEIAVVFPILQTRRRQLMSTFFSLPPNKLRNCGYFSVLDLKPACPLTSLLYCSVICKQFCVFPSRNQRPLLNRSLLFTIPICFFKRQNAFWNRCAFTA